MLLHAHEGGATGYGLLTDEAGARTDGYCLWWSAMSCFAIRSTSSTQAGGASPPAGPAAERGNGRP